MTGFSSHQVPQELHNQLNVCKDTSLWGRCTGVTLGNRHKLRCHFYKDYVGLTTQPPIFLSVGRLSKKENSVHQYVYAKAHC